MKKIKKWLYTIQQDILNGRYIDHYITLLIVVVVLFVDIFNIYGEHPGLVSAMTLAVLAMVSFSVLQDRRRAEQPSFISSNDEANSDYICEYIAMHKVKRAQLIQYSGSNVKRIIKKLLEKGVTVELLLQHPDALPKSPDLRSFQLSKMTTFYQELKTDFDNKNITFKYYQEPASIKGIKLDDSFLSMGWYTYQTKNLVDKTPWLYGHNNAVINVQMDRPEAQVLAATFDRLFDALWNTAVASEEISFKSVKR